MLVGLFCVKFVVVSFYYYYFIPHHTTYYTITQKRQKSVLQEDTSGTDTLLKLILRFIQIFFTPICYIHYTHH